MVPDDPRRSLREMSEAGLGELLGWGGHSQATMQAIEVEAERVLAKLKALATQEVAQANAQPNIE